jgi:hypothetical protein
MGYDVGKVLNCGFQQAFTQEGRNPEEVGMDPIGFG